MPGGSQLPVQLLSGVALQDATSATIRQCNWSTGAVFGQVTSTSPPLSELWTLYAWSLSAFGALGPVPGGVNMPPLFGRLGKLIAGVLINEPRAFPPFNQNPYSAYPVPSSALADTVWDGTTDPPFPQSGPTLPIVRTYQFTQPVDVYPSEQIAAGLWLTPMLACNTAISITSATMTIYYEASPAPSPTGPYPR